MLSSLNVKVCKLVFLLGLFSTNVSATLLEKLAPLKAALKGSRHGDLDVPHNQGIDVVAKTNVLSGFQVLTFSPNGIRVPTLRSQTLNFGHLVNAFLTFIEVGEAELIAQPAEPKLPILTWQLVILATGYVGAMMGRLELAKAQNPMIPAHVGGLGFLNACLLRARNIATLAGDESLDQLRAKEAALIGTFQAYLNREASRDSIEQIITKTRAQYFKNGAFIRSLLDRLLRAFDPEVIVRAQQEQAIGEFLEESVEGLALIVLGTPE